MFIVVTDESQVVQSGVPVLKARDEKEQEEIAGEIARILEAWPHRLANGLIFIMK